MTLNRILITLLVVFVVGILYLIPDMLNQRSYDDYYLHMPDVHTENGEYPLILFLHGSGNRGDDPEVLAEEPLMEYANKADSFPFIIAAPICDKKDSWHAKYLLEFLEKKQNEWPVDTTRIYVTGLSMGGFGALELASYAPDKIAAVVPVSARFRPESNFPATLKNVPVWAFHGEKDEIASYEQAVTAIERLKSSGAEAKLTSFPDLGHVCWDEAYDNPVLYDWLLTKSR